MRFVRNFIDRVWKCTGEIFMSTLQNTQLNGGRLGNVWMFIRGLSSARQKCNFMGCLIFSGCSLNSRLDFRTVIERLQTISPYRCNAINRSRSFADDSTIEPQVATAPFRVVGLELDRCQKNSDTEKKKPVQWNCIVFATIMDPIHITSQGRDFFPP